MMRYLFGIVLCILLVLPWFGCSSYTVEDWIREARQEAPALQANAVTGKAPQPTIEVGKRSRSVGVFRDVAAPKHEASKVGRRTISVGGTDWGKVASDNKLTILVVIGGIAVLVGVAAAVAFQAYLAGAAVALGGLALIAVAAYPWLLLILPIVAAVAAVWFLWHTAQGRKVRQAFRQTVTGVQQAKEALVQPEQRAEFNRHLETAQDEATKKLVHGVKG